ncbi:uncharacterized protein SEPMUDRAFT_11981, partial [Sphaerulina musiva SO2202]
RPPLPSRTSSTQSSQAPGPLPRAPSGPSPALPPRRPSETPSQPGYAQNRRGSTESTSSVTTSRSAGGELFKIRASEFDPSSLPALPPKRTAEEREAADKKYNGPRPLRHTKSTPRVAQVQQGTTPPAVPVRQTVIQPPLPVGNNRQVVPQRSESTSLSVRAEALPAPKARTSALSWGFNNETSNSAPASASRNDAVAPASGVPPPIPASTKPNLAALLATKPKPNSGFDLSARVAALDPSPTAPTNSCLHCRDFTGPDSHAARFPRQSIPSHDVGWLAQQLTAPFTSLTDKARSIFTWLHHNIAYNTQAFFSNNVQGSTPQSTIQSGLAVCEGYAGLFTALAVKAGMESFVISGASKGFGYRPLTPGQPIPPYQSDHAWNVVKIDGGEWKLIDSCWGAGNVKETQEYEKSFKPDWFQMSNNIFGLSHYPERRDQQYREDGTALSWEEYSMAHKDGTGATMFDSGTEEGISKTSMRPSESKIDLSQQGPTVRFSFQKICPHWDPIRNGKGPPYLFVLLIDAQEKNSDRNLPPLQTNGSVWWADVPREHLGRSGQKIMLIALTSFGGRDGRGLTLQEYQRGKGRCGWASSGIATWEI